MEFGMIGTGAESMLEYKFSVLVEPDTTGDGDGEDVLIDVGTSDDDDTTLLELDNKLDVDEDATV